MDQLWEAIAHGIDWALGQLTPEQWDAWLGWVTGLGGLIALSVAVLTYRRNVRMKREEGARLVFATVKHSETYLAGSEIEVDLRPFGVMLALNEGEKPLNIGVGQAGKKGKKLAVKFNQELVRTRILVTNGSKERMSPVYVHVHSLSAGRLIANVSPIYNINPESEEVVEVLMSVPPEGRPEIGASIVFRDSSGLWWKRHLNGPLKRARAVREESVRGIYWRHEPSVAIPGMPPQKKDQGAQGSYTKNVVEPPTWIGRGRDLLKKEWARLGKS